MKDALAELFALAKSPAFLEAESTDKTWQDYVDSHEFPIRQGRRHLFVFRGDVDHVNLRHWIYGLPSSQPFHRIPESDLWYFALDLPEESRVEYKLEVHHHGSGNWIEDPLNPRRAKDPYGANSVCFGDGYRVPRWALPMRSARPGVLEDLPFRSDAFGEERLVTLYTPARFRSTARYSLLMVHDGGDYLRYAQLKTVLDNLMHTGEIPPFIVALTHPGERLVEYADDPRHARFLAEELLPALEERLPLRRDPRHRILMGASFGAIASFSTAVNYPEHFGRLLLQSGSFAFSDIGPHGRSDVFDPVVRAVNRFRATPSKFAEKIFVSCGVYESLIYENRSIVPFFQSAGMEVRYRESRDGHNWENWRDQLREGLSWLLPGPLWMMYP